MPTPHNSRSPDNAHRRGVLAGGNWIVDRVKTVDVWPAQDALATILHESKGNGGGGYNLLKNLALLQCGFPLAGIGLIGQDADGAGIMRDCEALAIDHQGLHRTETATTSYTDVMTVSSSGRRTFFHHHGANALLGPQHFDFSTTRARIFFLGYIGLLKRLDSVDATGRTDASRVFESAQSAGMITIADLVSNETMDFQRTIFPSLRHLDYLLLNESELCRLANTGPLPRISSQTIGAYETVARAVLARGIRNAIVVHMPEGILFVSQTEPTLWQASVRIPPELIKGAAGAGDAFAAGFIHGLHEKWTVTDSLKLGVCVAAASLRDATCSGAVVNLQTCLEFGQTFGFNDAVVYESSAR